MGFIASAAEIAAESAAVGAGRVCFHNGKYLFADPTEEAISSALEQSVSGRYKLQAIREGKWTDLSKYAPIFDAASLLSVLMSCDFSAPVELEARDVIEAMRLKPGKADSVLRKTFYNALDQQAKHPSMTRLPRVLSFFTQLKAGLKEQPRYDYFMSYLSVFHEAQVLGLADIIVSRDRDAVVGIVSDLMSFMEREGQNMGGAAQAAGDCVLGQILSLADRDAASRRFRALRTSEHAALIEFFYWDLGALTYFGADEIEETVLTTDVQSTIASLIPIHAPDVSNEMAVGVSMDESFFRVYAPWLYFYAQQLPNIDFNFILCAEPDTADSLMREGSVFAQSLASLNRSGEPSNVRVYSMPTPDFVCEAKTFYACARFFALPELLSHYPQVYLMDADLYLSDNPTNYFQRLQEVPFASPDSPGPVGLSPWRRYMAGNIAANQSIADSQLLLDLQSYIVHGLQQPASWMLDQNALAFAAERSESGTFLLLNSFKRPFMTSKFMGTWESNFRKANTF